MMKVWKRAIAALLTMVLCLPATGARAAGTDKKTTAVDGGMSHTIALKSDGTVYAWGSNLQMQLGFATSAAEVTKPQQVAEVRNMTAVAAGYDFSAALSSDGQVYTWGASKQSEPTVVPGLSNVVAITAGQSELLALDQSGTVWQWAVGGTPAQVQGLSNVAAIEAGGSHYLALTFYGDVYAWGGNWNGQLGTGDTADKAAPQKLELYNIIDIAAGHAHSLAVAYDGTVYAWGSNTYGQLGNGNTTDSVSPVTTEAIASVVQVSAGNDVSMARTADNKIYTWGYGEYGQLGLSAAPISQSSPKAISNLAKNPVFIASGVYHNMYVSKDGVLYTWGRNKNYQLGVQQNINGKSPQYAFSQVATGDSYLVSGLTSASSWAAAELEGLYARGLVSPAMWQNYQEGMTRAELAHILSNLYVHLKGLSSVRNMTAPFQDIGGHQFQDDIIKAYYYEIVTGSGTSFYPDRILTRQETVKMICTFLAKAEDISIPSRASVSMSYYNDAFTIADWAAPSVAYAYQANIMRGANSNFSPLELLSREEGLLIVARLAEKYDWR